MKVLVLSDSHGFAENLFQAVEQERPDYVIHLGDGARDVHMLCEAQPLLPVAQVAGNCDFSAYDLPETRIAEYGGVRVWMCHGHRFGVKSGLLRLDYAAREVQAQVALFGHTHQPFCEYHNGLWLMNPGTCGYSSRPTCGILIIHGGAVTCEIREIDHRRN